MDKDNKEIKPATVASLIQRKRFNNEKKILSEQPLGYITAYPKEDNPLIWYILVVGQKESHYEGGHFIGEIHHSPKYPAEPPDYYMRTPNGRYDIDKKICLSNSGYHKGEWSSTWNIHTILVAFYSIWLDDKEHGISHITRSKEERLKLANESIQFNMKKYKDIYEKFNFESLSFDVDNDPRYSGKTTKNSVSSGTNNQMIQTQPEIKQNVQVNSTEEIKSEVKLNEEIKPNQEIKTIEEIKPNQEIKPIEVEDGEIIEKKNSKVKIIKDEERNVKQKIIFEEIFNDISLVNKSIDDQQNTIRNLTDKLSNSLK